MVVVILFNYYFTMCCQVVDPETGRMSVTNVFQFTFELRKQDPPQIIPKTYHEVLIVEYFSFLVFFMDLGIGHWARKFLVKLLVHFCIRIFINF